MSLAAGRLEDLLETRCNLNGLAVARGGIQDDGNGAQGQASLFLRRYLTHRSPNATAVTQMVAAA